MDLNNVLMMSFKILRKVFVVLKTGSCNDYCWI